MQWTRSSSAFYSGLCYTFQTICCEALDHVVWKSSCDPRKARMDVHTNRRLKPSRFQFLSFTWIAITETSRINLTSADTNHELADRNKCGQSMKKPGIRPVGYIRARWKLREGDRHNASIAIAFRPSFELETCIQKVYNSMAASNYQESSCKNWLENDRSLKSLTFIVEKSDAAPVNVQALFCRKRRHIKRRLDKILSTCRRPQNKISVCWGCHRPVSIFKKPCVSWNLVPCFCLLGMKQDTVKRLLVRKSFWGSCALSELESSVSKLQK